MEKSPTEYGGPWRGAHTLANTPNIGNNVTDIARAERDTLKSTYVTQQPLFGKAAEAAKIFAFFFVFLCFFW